MGLLFVCLVAHDSESRRWPCGVDLLICQTFAASPAEPGELLFWFRSAIYTAVSQAEAAAASAQQQAAAARAQQRTQKAAAARAQQQAAAARKTKPTEASSPPATCGLTKEYVDYAVKFRDTCTGEWAQHERH